MLQLTNAASSISRLGTFSPFLSLVVLFLVLPSYFIVPGVKISKLYQFLSLNVGLFLILFTNICTDSLSAIFKMYLK